MNDHSNVPIPQASNSTHASVPTSSLDNGLANSDFHAHSVSRSTSTYVNFGSPNNLVFEEPELIPVDKTPTHDMDMVDHPDTNCNHFNSAESTDRSDTEDLTSSSVIMADRKSHTGHLKRHTSVTIESNSSTSHRQFKKPKSMRRTGSRYLIGKFSCEFTKLSNCFYFNLD